MILGSATIHDASHRSPPVWSVPPPPPPHLRLANRLSVWKASTRVLTGTGDGAHARAARSADTAWELRGILGTRMHQTAPRPSLQSMFHRPV